MNRNIMICGVGGQGTVLASKIIASAAMAGGNVVHSAETIGMAQRGGPVTSHVRIGEKAHSPLIPYGESDLILAFEPAEAVRNLPYLKKEGMVIVSSVPVKPTTESLQETGYEGREMIDYLKSKCKTIVVDAEELCRPFGSSRYFNVAILGVAVGASALGITRNQMVEEIENRVPDKFLKNNLGAFAAGMKIGETDDIK